MSKKPHAKGPARGVPGRGGVPSGTGPDPLLQAVRLHQAGHLAEAERAYRDILTSRPKHPDALHFLGVLLHQKGDSEAGADLIRQAIQKQPKSPEAHNHLGLALTTLGRLNDAEAALRKAIRLNPRFPEALSNLGIVQRDQGKLSDAAVSLRRALQLNPGLMEALYNLGTVLTDLGRPQEALAVLDQGLQRQPANPSLLAALGHALSSAGRYREAAAAFLTVSTRVPNDAEAHRNLGTCFDRLGLYEDAEKAFRKAVALDPDDLEARHRLGNVLKMSKKFVEAEEVFIQLLDRLPESADALASLLYVRRWLCQWERSDELLGRLREALATPQTGLSPFLLLSLDVGPEDQARCAATFSENPRKAMEKRGQTPYSHPRRPRGGRERITVGYISPDFRAHPVAYLVAELFELHDRDRFQVLGYALGPKSDDPMRRRLEQGFDRLVDVEALKADEAAERIHRDQVDILVDLAGYTFHSRTEILAFKPAPIQVNYLGFPCTMGADFMDYVIVDPFVAPPAAQPHFAERLVHMPDCYMINDATREIAADTPTREACGLPPDGVVFCCFNTIYKFTPELFAVWMRLLGAVPGSVLWMPEPRPEARKNLRKEARAANIDPDRLRFAPRTPTVAEHLARVRNADLFLDTFPYNAHSTASDMLWAGVPVLTRSGDTFASRVAGSLLHTLELPELITHSLSEYEARALHLAQHPDELAALRRRVANGRETSPLFDSARFTRHLETAFEHMWEAFQQGRPPAPITVTG